MEMDEAAPSMTTAVIYSRITKPVDARLYQFLKGTATTFNPASTINVELHNVAIDACVRQVEKITGFLNSRR